MISFLKYILSSAFIYKFCLARSSMDKVYFFLEILERIAEGLFLPHVDLFAQDAVSHDFVYANVQPIVSETNVIATFALIAFTGTIIL